MRVILASQSPRRKELMDLLNINYEVIVSKAEEILENDLSIIEQAQRLAYIKAKSIFDNTSGSRVVIGADTIVVKDNTIFGKPKNREDAYRILNLLKNDTHQVITGICVLGKNEYIDYDITDIFVNDMTVDEINGWLDRNEFMDKAGAYAIQGAFSKHIDKIVGNYTTVVGLPIHKIYKALQAELA